MRRSLPLLAVMLVVVSLSAWAWSELYLHSQNTLLQNTRWVSSKQRMQLHLVGSVDFLKARQPLAGNQLDLGTWSGFNEVLLNRMVELRTLRLRFRLKKKAHLSVMFARDTSGYLGLRFSRDPETPSGFFRAFPAGRFESFEAIDLEDTGAWHRLTIELSQAGGAAELDGDLFAQFDVAAASPQTLGFRSGYHSAVVDDVEIELVSGEVLRESFRHHRGRLRALGAFFLATIAIAGGVALCVRVAKRREPGRAPAFTFVLVSLVLAVVGSFLLAFDVLYWSSKYFYSSPGIRFSKVQGLPMRVEELRHSLLEEALPAWIGDERRLRPEPEPRVEDAIVQRGRPPRGPSEEYTLYGWRGSAKGRFVPFDRVSELPPRRPGVTRVVFIGSSQTWGAGAESPDDTFVARTHRKLVALLPSASIETLNLSMNGSTTYEQLPLYMQISELVQPDLVVVNFGNNDHDPEEFAQHIFGFIDWSRGLGADTVLLKEANSHELPDGVRLAAKHSRLEEVGAETEVPVLDLHGFVNSPDLRRSGFLWWDYVHFSAYGHERVADWLAPQLARILRKREL